MPERFWFHDLDAARQGPDWIFDASFAAGSAALLSEAFRALAPRDFAYYRATQAACPIHGRNCTYDLYADTAQYEAIVAQLEARLRENIYVYHTMQVCGDAFQLARGYGGYPGQHGPEETRCIRALAQTPALIMSGWALSYGGVTYPYQEWMRGTTSAELLHYLDLPG